MKSSLKDHNGLFSEFDDFAVWFAPKKLSDRYHGSVFVVLYQILDVREIVLHLVIQDLGFGNELGPIKGDITDRTTSLRGKLAQSLRGWLFVYARR